MTFSSISWYLAIIVLFPSFHLDINVTSRRFFKLALADGLSLEIEWQQVSSQVWRTLLSIQSGHNNVVVLMVSTRSLISQSSRHFINPLATVPSAPITFGLTVTFMFHRFFCSLARSRYLTLFSFPFGFTQWSAGTAKFNNELVIFFF